MRFSQCLPRETQHAKDDSQDSEAGDLDGLAAEFVDG